MPRLHFKFFIGFWILAFGIFLDACGSGTRLLNDSKDFARTSEANLNTNPDNNPNSNPNVSTSPAPKSNDLHLEGFVKLIYSEAYDGYLIVQLENSEGVFLNANRLITISGRGKYGVSVLNKVLDRVGKDIVLGKYYSDSLWTMRNQIRQMETLWGKQLLDLGAFYRINVLDPAKGEEILRSLWKESGIRAIYPGFKSLLYGMEAIPDLTSLQGYLHPYEESKGLSITAAWSRNVKGRGVGIVDMQTDWNPNHEDLPRWPTIITTNSRNPLALSHGTAVLGVLVGLDTNERGIRGIATESIVTTTTGNGSRAAAAVDGVGTEMNPGDVLLLTIGRPAPTRELCLQLTGNDGTKPLVCGLPEEFFVDAFASIQIATMAGITVVEAAGVGPINFNNGSIYFPGSVDLRSNDSGAILVGSARGLDQRRDLYSNCGGRVNLFGWSGIVTTSYPGSPLDWEGISPFSNDQSQPNLYYTNRFGGTSSAAAIIAGAAALLQSYAKREMGGKKYLTSSKVREILMISGVGAVDDGDCPIGKQPNMDRAMDLFDQFWTSVRQDFPELVRGEEVRGERRQALLQRGVGLICKLYDPAHSDPSCPEKALCVLDQAFEVDYECNRATGVCSYSIDPPDEPKVYNCNSARCLPLTQRSEYDCLAGALWPSGLRIGKTLDLDGDQKADLVNWSESSDGTSMKWQIDLSSDELGTWDIEVRTPHPGGRLGIWPVIEDYDSDGRADLSVYDKERGVWSIKFTNNELLRTTSHESRTTHWDWQIQLPYHDELNRDVRLTKYGRPMPGDYNGDRYIDLAIARSDGIWSIDFGGPSREDYGRFDQDVRYLTESQLAAAPGWGYLPIHSRYYSITYKVPDEVGDGGQFWNVRPDGTLGRFGDDMNLMLGGNDLIPLPSNLSSDLGLKSSDGLWRFWYRDGTNDLATPPPHSIFGGLECHPFVADFDNDNQDDRAVQCPTEFIIVPSSTQTERRIPLGYNPREFSLPGRPFVGGLSYATVQRFIQWQLESSNESPIIPVDMASPSICLIPWQRGDLPNECL